MSTGQSIISLIRESQDLHEYRDLHWTGSFADYLDRVEADPQIARTAAAVSTEW